MKKIIVAALVSLCAVFSVQARSYCGDIADMSVEQQVTLARSYQYGEPYDLGYTLSAIAWKESLAGKYKINYSDPSFGVYHNVIHQVARREGVTGNFEKNRLAQRLVEDDEYAASQAIAELQSWLKYHKGDLYKAWASYNAGTAYEYGLDYAADVKKKIRVLKRCIGPGGSYILTSR